MSKKVLLAIDDSDIAEKAARWYLGETSKPTDEVIAVYISELPWPPISDVGDLASSLEQLVLAEKKAKSKAQELQDKYEKLIKDKGLACTFILEEGIKAGEVLCNIASQQGADMIVMGSRGSGTVRRTIFGSVSDYVLHQVDIPVLVFKDDRAGLNTISE